jgi:uncharacterized protein (DUF1697 family)
MISPKVKPAVSTRRLRPASAARERTWIALFRGINVMGNNKLPMKDLATLLRGLKFREVRTYIQSGNAVFASAGTAASLSARISAAVARRFGLHPYVVLFEARELAQAIARNPFPEGEAVPQSLHLWFLEECPAAARHAGLETVRAETERFKVHDKVLYLHAPLGIGRSKLAPRAEKILGTKGTARNWRTVCTLYAMAKGDA